MSREGLRPNCRPRPPQCVIAARSKASILPASVEVGSIARGTGAQGPCRTAAWRVQARARQPHVRRSPRIGGGRRRSAPPRRRSCPPCRGARRRRTAQAMKGWMRTMPAASSESAPGSTASPTAWPGRPGEERAARSGARPAAHRRGSAAQSARSASFGRSSGTAPGTPAMNASNHCRSSSRTGCPLDMPHDEGGKEPGHFILGVSRALRDRGQGHLTGPGEDRGDGKDEAERALPRKAPCSPGLSCE